MQEIFLFPGAIKRENLMSDNKHMAKIAMAQAQVEGECKL